MGSYEASTTLPSTTEAVFDFLIQPANALKLSPPAMGLNIIDAPERFELGSRFEFEVGGFGPVQQFVHEIIEINPPGSYTEKLVKGPLPHWVHEHIVEMHASGEVLVIDRIEFEPPGGLARFLVTEARILDSLATAFDHRYRELKRLMAHDE